MRNLLIAGLLSILVAPHFSFAAEKVDMHSDASQVHSQAHHVRSHSKADSTSSVDINHADATQLTSLKGIGAKRAEAILSYRQAHGQFQAVDGLSSVKGIGKKGLSRLVKNNPGRITLTK